MESILYNISQVLGITIIHSLWQGLLVYFVLRIALTGAPSLSPLKKYNLAIGAMLCVSFWFIYTLITGIHDYNWVKLNSFTSSPLLPYIGLHVNAPINLTYYNAIAGYMPYICILYFAGLITNLAKLGLGWNKITEIKRHSIHAEQMQQFINSFSKKLNISKHVRLNFSELIDVPCMVGYFKPIIFLPVSIATNLSACEIEAILLHELSHIKRNDYLVNLLQQIITVTLFFNPFAQLINRIINRERENSCDDLVVEKTGRPLIYARALLKLEETRGAHLQLVLAATGKRFHLLNRIERIMKTKKQTGGLRHLLAAIFLLLGGLSSLAWFNPKTAEAKTIVKPARSTAGIHLFAATNPVTVIKANPAALKNNSLTVVKDSNKYILVSDTSKHHESKIVITDNNGNKKEYDNFEELSPEAQEAFFKQHPEINRKELDSLKKFYSSPEWKAQMDAMKKQGEEMKKQFDNPEWKAQMLAMKKQGEEMKKQFDSPEWKAQMLAMKKQGEEMKKQFNNPEWKAQMDAMNKQGEEMKRQFNSPEWKAQMDAMNKQGEEMKKQFDSPEWKAQMDAMNKQGEEMKKQFNSPEWKAQMDAMNKQGEEMKKQFDSPEWKAQMDAMKKQGEEMKKQFNSPEWKKQMQKWMLKDSTNGVQIYTPQTPHTDKKTANPTKKEDQ
jgi:bla regulator protein BlaR1